MKINTERLIIREFSFSDDIGLYEMCSDEHTAYMAGWRPHISVDITRNVIAGYMYDLETYAIIKKNTNEFIGTISLYKNESRYGNNRDLGFCLNKNFRGKGYMKEACLALIDYGFNVLDLDILCVCHATFNKECEYLIESLPFEYEGTLRKYRELYTKELCDCKMYSIIKENYLGGN